MAHGNGLPGCAFVHGSPSYLMHTGGNRQEIAATESADRFALIRM